MTTVTSTGPRPSPTSVGSGWYSAHIYYYQPDKDGLILEGVRPRSEFHHMMFANHTYRERVFDDPRFHRYRVGLNCTYLQINRLGLAPPQRMRTCHLAASAVEDLYGLNAVDMIRSFVQQHPDPPAT